MNRVIRKAVLLVVASLLMSDPALACIYDVPFTEEDVAAIPHIFTGRLVAVEGLTWREGAKRIRDGVEVSYPPSMEAASLTFLVETVERGSVPERVEVIYVGGTNHGPHRLDGRLDLDDPRLLFRVGVTSVQLPNFLMGPDPISHGLGPLSPDTLFLVGDICKPPFLEILDSEALEQGRQQRKAFEARRLRRSGR